MALLEILLYRVLYPLLRPEADVVPRWLMSGLETGAVFSLNLLAVLGLLVLGLAIGQVLKGALGAARPGRVAFAVVAAVYLPLSALSLSPGLVETVGLGAARAGFLLQVGFICLAMLATLAALPAGGHGRVKLGLVLLLVPLGLHFVAYFSVATERLRMEQAADLVMWGQWAVVGMLLVSPLCFLSGRWRAELGGSGMGLALGSAALGAMTLLALALADWDMAARLSQSVLGMRLPTQRWLLGLDVLAAGEWIFVTVALLLQGRGDGPPLRGFGLILIGLAGYQMQDNYQLMLLALGMLCVARSALTDSSAVPLR